MARRLTALLTILALVLATFAPSAPASAAEKGDVAAMRQALEVFKQGRTALKARDFDAALKFFRKAHAIYEHQPLIILALAKTLDRAKQPDNALRYYKLFIREAEPDDRDRKPTLARIAAIEAALARRPAKLVLKGLPAGAAVRVDGKTRQVDPGNGVTLKAGVHGVEVTMGNRLPFVRKGLALAPGQTLTLEVVLLEPVDPSKLPRDHMWTWVAGGATALATLTLGVLAVRRVTLSNSYFELVSESGKVNQTTIKKYDCKGTTLDDCPALRDEANSRRDAILQNDKLLYGAGIAAGVFAIGTVAAYFAAPVKKQARATLQLTPTWDGRRVGAGLTLRF